MLACLAEVVLSCGYCIGCCPDSAVANIVEFCTKVLPCKNFAVLKYKQWARWIAKYGT